MGKELYQMITSTFDYGFVILLGIIVVPYVWINTRSSLMKPDIEVGRQDRSLRLKILNEDKFSELYRFFVGKLIKFIDELIGDVDSSTWTSNDNRNKATSPIKNMGSM